MRKAIATSLAVAWLCAVVQAHADPLPGSAAPGDPFNFYFNGVGNAGYQLTDSSGSITTGPSILQAPAGFINANPGIIAPGNLPSGNPGYLTYQLPDFVFGGYVGVLAPGTANPGWTDFSTNPDFHIYSIPNSYFSSVSSELQYGLGFFNISNSAFYMQLYQQSSGSLMAPSGFTNQFQSSGIIAVEMTNNALGFTAFTYNPLSTTLEQEFNIKADNKYVFQPSADSYKALAADYDAAPEPSVPVALAGMAALGVLGFGLRRKVFFR